MRFGVSGKRRRVASQQALVDGVRVVNFPMPVLADVHLVHLTVDDTLTHGFHVTFVRFIGVGHRFTMRLGRRY